MTLMDKTWCSKTFIMYSMVYKGTLNKLYTYSTILMFVVRHMA